MSFEVKRLVNHRAIVSGTDTFGVTGSAALDTTQWDEIQANVKFDQATEAFDEVVEEFFAPMLAAADNVKAALVPRPEDPASYVVLSEEVEGVEAKPRVLVRLDDDTIVLRLIDSGETDRLVWVDGKLEVLEHSPVAFGAISDES